MRWNRVAGPLAALLFVSAHLSAAPVELLTNGDFETGTFAGWTVTDLAGGSGTWSVTGAAVTPISGLPTVGPAGGAFYAVTDQTGPGTHALTQSFVVPVGATSVVLSFDMFVNDSDGGPFFDPSGLDHTSGGTGAPNQHSRVDLLTAAALPFDTGAGVLANYYMLVDPQATNPNPYTPYLFDITGLVVPGGTYQIRFAEVDNQLFLNQGVDNVSIRAQVVPEPGTLALLGGGLVLLRRRRRR